MLRSAPPRGPGWSHEVKFDGWRLQLHKAGTRVRLLSRHGHDLTSTFPTIASAVATLDATTAILDGELVATNAEGVPDFRALQCRSPGRTLAVWVFDLLEVNGRDVRALSLEERRHHLEQQLASRPDHGTLRYSESFADPARLLAAAHDFGIEGVVSKCLDAPYRSGRRPEWVKVKTESWRVANRERWRLFEKSSGHASPDPDACLWPKRPFESGVAVLRRSMIQVSDVVSSESGPDDRCWGTSSVPLLD